MRYPWGEPIQMPSVFVLFPLALLPYLVVVQCTTNLVPGQTPVWEQQQNLPLHSLSPPSCSLCRVFAPPSLYHTQNHLYGSVSRHKSGICQHVALVWNCAFVLAETNPEISSNDYLEYSCRFRKVVIMVVTVYFWILAVSLISVEHFHTKNTLLLCFVSYQTVKEALGIALGSI